MKGNLFLGYGTKSVGDVVFYKRKGSSEQMARARNRKPNNPKTNKQLYQRAIMATVLQAYSAGKAIFDHSFEGKAVPDGSMRRFMSLNLRRLRSAIADDLSGDLANTTPGRVVAPGATTPVPFAYRISEGSYDNNLLVYSAAEKGFAFPTPNSADTSPAAYLSNWGFTPGDIYTIVAFGVMPNVVIGSYPNGDFYKCAFGWARLEVRSDAPTTGNVTVGNCFNITSSHVFDYANEAVDSFFTIDGVFDSDQISKGSIGAIRSRHDSGVRSTSDMIMVDAADYGIMSDDLLDAWRAGTVQVGESDLILEGAGQSQPRPSGEPIAASGELQIFADPECTRYATGSEKTVYCRFNSDINLSLTPAGIAGSYDANDGKTPTADLMRTGTAFSLIVWNYWVTSGVTTIHQGDVLPAINTTSNTVSNPSVIMSFGD